MSLSRWLCIDCGHAWMSVSGDACPGCGRKAVNPLLVGGTRRMRYVPRLTSERLRAFKDLKEQFPLQEYTVADLLRNSTPGLSSRSPRLDRDPQRGTFFKTTRHMCAKFFSDIRSAFK